MGITRKQERKVESWTVRVNLLRESGNKTSTMPLTWNPKLFHWERTSSSIFKSGWILKWYLLGRSKKPSRPMVEPCEMLFKGVHAISDFINYCSLHRWIPVGLSIFAHGGEYLICFPETDRGNLPVELLCFQIMSFSCQNNANIYISWRWSALWILVLGTKWSWKKWKNLGTY